MVTNLLKLLYSTKGNLPLKRYFTISRDIFYFHKCERSAVDNQWIESKDAAKNFTMYKTVPQNTEKSTAKYLEC